jgi:hypothetical protein
MRMNVNRMTRRITGIVHSKRLRMNPVIVRFSCGDGHGVRGSAGEEERAPSGARSLAPIA